MLRLDDGRNHLQIKSNRIGPNTGNSRKHCDLHVNISVKWLETFNLVLEIHVHILLPAELNFFK